LVNPHERLDGIAVSERPVVRPAPRLLSVFCVRRDNYGSVQNLIDEIARRRDRLPRLSTAETFLPATR
jgi:hypothetical protein